MNMHSVKARFFGSYIFLIVLFIIQLPIVYSVVGGMSNKYAEVETADSLRKRAIEISYILNRHILNGEEELESVFQDMRKEYSQVINSLRTGTEEFGAITDPEILMSLDTVSNEWQAMDNALVEAMSSGDNLTEALLQIESDTYPIVGLFNTAVAGFVGLKDQSYSKSINLAGLQRMRTVNLSYLLERYSRSNYELDEIKANIAKTVKGFDETLEGLKYGSTALGLKAVKNPGLMAKLTAIDGIWDKRKNLIVTSMHSKEVFASKLTQLAEDNTPRVMKATAVFTKLIASKARSTAMTGVLIMALTISLSVICAIYFMWSTNKKIIQPVLKVKDTVKDFADGRLTSRANIKITLLGREVKDEIATLGESVDNMGVEMSKVISGIVGSANQLATATQDLSATSRAIEDGANKQTAQTTQVATAMEEMSATVIEVAKNAQQVSESSTAAQSTAEGGGEIVRNTIVAMQEVSESTTVTASMIEKLGKSSEEIGSIISVINDIADQTNLLALNAAIEAARAGEQGRGFAVVADEVRKLAERTTTATKEISGMIGSIQSETTTAVDAMSDGTQKVENGVRLANDTEDALNQIVTGVQSVNDMVRQIATSTEEQSATTDEISRSMDEITEVAQANAVSISDVAKTTSNMAQLATELKGLVARFDIGNGSSVLNNTTETAQSNESSGDVADRRSIDSPLRKVG